MKVPFDLEKQPSGGMLRSRLPGFQNGGQTVFLPGRDSSDVTKASVRRVIGSVRAKTAVVVAKIQGKAKQLPEYKGYRTSIRMKPTKARSRIKMGWRERGLLFERTGFARSMEAHESYPGGELPKHLRKANKTPRKATSPKLVKRKTETWALPPDRAINGYEISMFLDTHTNHFVVVKEEIEGPNGEVMRFLDQREALDQYQEYIRKAA